VSTSRLHVRDVEHIQGRTPAAWYPFCGNTTCWCMEPNPSGPCAEHKEHPLNPRCEECGWPEYRHTEPGAEPTHVADVILRVLQRTRITQVDVARDTGLSTKHVNQLLRKHVALSPEIALLFEQHLGLDAEHLLITQARWQLHQLRATKENP
jgi:plasmid maintenance system antidote protein VapI